MSNEQIGPLLFVRSIRLGIGGRTVDVDGRQHDLPSSSYADAALRVDMGRAVEHTQKIWTAWAIGKTSKQVECKYIPTHYFVNRGFDPNNPEGASTRTTINEMDESKRIPGTPWDMSRIYENSFSLDILAPVEELQIEVGSPFFVGPHPDWKPSAHRVVVALAFERWDAFPDVKARAAFHRSGGSFGCDDKSLDRFWRLAHRSRPKAGDVFPIQVQHEGRAIYGALVLEERHGGFFAIKKRPFRAQVYLSEAMEALPVNTVLSRRVEWQDCVHVPLTMEAIEDMEQLKEAKSYDAMERIEWQKSFARMRELLAANAVGWRPVLGELCHEEADVATVIQSLMPDRR